jgi:two-component system, cell cycle sensor histidine kinase and response regulator CckA
VDDRGTATDRRLHAALDAIDLVGVILDPVGRVAFCNDVGLALTGWAREEILGADSFDVMMPPEIREAARASFLAYLADDRFPQQHENQLLTRDGRRRVVAWHNALLRDESGRVDGLASIGEDVTDLRAAEAARIAAEAALEASEERLRTTVEGVDAIVSFRRRGGDPMLVSPPIERILGIPPDAIGGYESWNALVHPDDLDACLARWNDPADQWAIEYRMRRADGAWIWVLDRGHRLAAVDDTGPGLIGVIVDVTARHEAAERLVRLAAAVEQAAEAVVITDAAVQVVFVNAAFEQMTGYAEEEVLGQDLRHLYRGLVPADVTSTVTDTLLQGRSWEGEFDFARKDGRSLRLEVSISPLVDRSGRFGGVVSVGWDVTADRALEARVRQAERLQVVGQLAGGVAHDFNNLLTAIGGYSELALAQIPSDSPARGDLESVLAATRRASGLTRQLLAFSRRLVLEPRVVDPAAVIDGLLPLLRTLLGEHIDVSVEHAEPRGHVRVDPGQLEQVIVNLCVNARDAMPDGGRLLIRTESVQTTAEEAWSRAADGTGAAGGPAEGGPMEPEGPTAWRRITVSDDGVGMEAHVLARMYEPFYTTKAPGTGSGMGLATVYGIVQQSAGRIACTSERGGGTTFIIDLPSVDAPVEKEAVAAVSVSGAPTGTEAILVAEDEEPVRIFLTRVLRDLGYAVTATGSGDEALLAAEDPSVRFDLLVTDVRMPGIQGPELARRLHLSRPDLPVIYVSGLADEARAGIGDAGSIRTLEKPLDVATLGTAVRAALDVRR